MCGIIYGTEVLPYNYKVLPTTIKIILHPSLMSTFESFDFVFTEYEINENVHNVL